jgi:hypothetical protein
MHDRSTITSPAVPTYHIRAITIDGGTEDTITVDDLDKYIDDHDGGPPDAHSSGTLMSSKRSTARSLVCIRPASRSRSPRGGARRVDKPWHRPWGELTSRATYRPDRQTYATLQRDDQAVIDEIDAAIEALLKTGACSALTVARMAAAEILGHHPITNIKNRDLRFDAYARMAGRKRYLPGLKNYDHPIADALQVSFWILQLDAATSIRTETAEEKRRRKCERFLQRERALSSKGTGVPPSEMDASGAVMLTTDAGRELLRDLHPDRELLKRFLPPKWRRITKDDVTAAWIVISNTSSILYFAQRDRQRWHYDDDGTAKTDETIIRLLLRDRLTAREIAARLRVDDTGSGVIKRFKAAIAQISDVVGPLPKSTREEVAEKVNVPFKTLFPQIRVFVRNIEGLRRPVVDDAWAHDVLERAIKKVWPPISHFWATPKLQRWNTSWFSGGIWASRLGAAPELRRWSATWFNDGIVFAPERERKIDTPYFCGPVVELKNGELRPRAHGGVVYKDDTVARFERAVTRADDEPLFEQSTPDLN